jgi:N-acetylglucosaminyl-diphospho-decaprenol L-rhamnosyltransferase
MSEIDVVVVIVTYKSAELTIECLGSIEGELNTPGVRIRVIVVDNASGDGPIVARAIEKNGWSSWVTLVVAPKNAGFAYGNNVGFQRAYEDARPDYLHMLNPDTLLRKGAISALVHFLEQHPSVGIAGSSFENLDGSDWPFAFRFPSLLSELDEGVQLGLVTHLLQRWTVTQHMTQVSQPTDWVAGASMMIRASVLDSIGGLDENYFLYFEETDFCFRAKMAGYSTWYVPESRVMHIAGQSTKVTERDAAPKRLPAYWFESRRRYFAITHGVFYAIGIDAVALFARMLGLLKHIVQGRVHQDIPYFIRDLAGYSLLHRKNRKLPEIKCFVPRI